MFDLATDEITEGSIPRALLVLAAPLVAQNFALVAQSVVDIFWVGRLGEEAVAAVGLVIPYTALLMVPLVMLFVGSQILTSQRVGADDIESARRVPFNAVALVLPVSLLLAGVVVAFGDELVALLNPSPAVAPLAVTYLTAFAVYALLPSALSDTLESGFTAWGDTRTAFIVNVSAIVVNLVLDPFLILGWWEFPRWEIFGAAVATGVGYAVGTLVALWYTTRDDTGFTLTRDALTLRPALFRELVEVGYPVAIQNTGRQLARVLMVSVVSITGGAAGLAAYTIGARVSTIAFVPAGGLGQAATSVIGQNLGADHPDRAERTTWVGVAVAAVGLSAVGVVQYLFPATIAQLFVPDISGPALQSTVLYLQILVFGYWALGAIYTLEAGFNGASRTNVSMWSTMVQYWGVRLPIAAGGALVLSRGVEAAFWAVTLSNVAAAVWLGGYYWYSTRDGMLERAAESAGSTAAD
ncbi:putative efflux protein, MATE family [Halogranum amylolyticum]|uniref:Multidrug-efflux transporter n=1 Tax=Halogranum amylolyticum TaxID=660520 RepID=A0A1H8R6D0_9EURY|nr:MATE family efflux transporter [Halogranum amylolyticum]SEO62015.1 putative efflux protein, MATE family [Halogranum amylolyticum]